MRKVALDYGGVIDYSPGNFAQAIQIAQTKGYQFFVLSHALPGDDLKKRSDFALRVGATDISFADLTPHQEPEILRRKALLCKEYEIEIFVDDDRGRCEAVSAMNPGCIVHCLSGYAAEQFVRTLE